MQRPQLEHLIRAAAETTSPYEFAVIGSQPILARVDAPPLECMPSGLPAVDFRDGATAAARCGWTGRWCASFTRSKRGGTPGLLASCRGRPQACCLVACPRAETRPVCCAWPRVDTRSSSQVHQHKPLEYRVIENQAGVEVVTGERRRAHACRFGTDPVLREPLRPRAPHRRRQPRHRVDLVPRQERRSGQVDLGRTARAQHLRHSVAIAPADRNAVAARTATRTTTRTATRTATRVSAVVAGVRGGCATQETGQAIRPMVVTPAPIPA